ncbi:ArsR/SmtB family transcription factor [Hyphobacterium sp.]|uniref:ArsR/SmtB family transcription factor n=1 Tax=Hyphobacterium sp. TaxID=2004662 RepID=UPI003BA9CDF0
MTDAELDTTFAALSNSTRRAILARLAEGDATVNELAKPFDMSLPAISKHLRVLERAGLISRRKNAQFRPCTMNAAPLAGVASWAEKYRPIWQARFDAMGEEIRKIEELANE